jgi:adenosine deaminase
MESTEDFIKKLPKIELHAHIGGSIREATIEQLLEKTIANGTEDKLNKEQLLKAVRVTHNDHRTMEQCFQLFDIIHRITTSLDVMARIVDEVLHDFRHEDNCRYIELRSTPREFPDAGTNSRDYVQVVLDRIARFQSQENMAHRFVDAQLLLSINRAQSFQKAEETIKLAAEYFGKGVCGLDFSGNCYVADFSKFQSLFEYARRQHGIPCTLHFAECDNFQDSRDILNFHPERVGHAAVMNEELEQELIKRKIPIEICFTSNILCKMHQSFDLHPFKRYYQNNHPMAICTDDKGVFNTSLCKEFSILTNRAYYKELFSANPSDMELKQKLFDISKNSIEFCFCSESVKQDLRREFDEFKEKHNLN